MIITFIDQKSKVIIFTKKYREISLSVYYIPIITVWDELHMAYSVPHSVHMVSFLPDTLLVSSDRVKMLGYLVLSAF